MGVSSEREGCFEARETFARVEERGRFALTSRFSWAIESLSAGGAEVSRDVSRDGRDEREGPGAEELEARGVTGSLDRAF